MEDLLESVDVDSGCSETQSEMLGMGIGASVDEAPRTEVMREKEEISLLQMPRKVCTRLLSYFALRSLWLTHISAGIMTPQLYACAMSLHPVPAVLLPLSPDLRCGLPPSQYEHEHELLLLQPIRQLVLSYACPDADTGICVVTVDSVH